MDKLSLVNVETQIHTFGVAEICALNINVEMKQYLFFLHRLFTVYHIWLYIRSKLVKGNNSTHINSVLYGLTVNISLFLRKVLGTTKVTKNVFFSKQRTMSANESVNMNNTDTSDKETHLFSETSEDVQSFTDKGFLQLPKLLSLATCQKLRDFIIQDLASTLKQNEDEQEKRFSNIRERNHRWDLKLNANPIVHEAMREILSNDGLLQSTLAPLCECSPDKLHDVVLAELGSLISEPGAKHQQWHADTAHTGPSQPDCICCFVTLQETPVSLGPTQLIPYTHLSDFHTTAMSNFPPKGLIPTSVTPKSMETGYTAAGEALLMDCRLYHRGSANTHSSDDCDGKRVVFYFTVRSRKAPKPGGFLFTILEELNDMPLMEFLENKF